MNKIEKATILSIMYAPSDSVEIQGKRRDIQKYINSGYYIKEQRNGYWVLVKSAQLNVAVKNSFLTRMFNMKADVCEYYRRTRISKSLIDRFKQDIEEEKVILYMDSEGNYSLK